MINRYYEKTIKDEACNFYKMKGILVKKDIQKELDGAERHSV